MNRRVSPPNLGRVCQVENLLVGRTAFGSHLSAIADTRLRDWLEYLQDLFREQYLIQYGPDDWKPALGKALEEAARYKTLSDFLDRPTEQIDLLAAYGILKVDRVASQYIDGASGWGALFDATDLVECEHYVSLAINGNDRLVDFLASAQVREAARSAAIERHARSPQSAVKRIVRECWESWREQPAQYESTAAFARAMLDKFPDELRSQPVIERWVRDWRADLD